MKLDPSFIAGVFFVLGLYMLVKISQLQDDVKGMKNMLEQMNKHMQLSENPINNELRDLIKEGKDIEAVKVARETLGLSLLEGKQYVDALKSEND